MKIHYSSKTNEWYTPQPLYDKLNAKYNFNLDPCATSENAKCDKYFTKEDNGLIQQWDGNVFVNPPYGREIKQWVEKAYEEWLRDKNRVIVMLIPARTDTRYWHDWIFPYASDITFIKGRIKFGGSNKDAPFPSAIVVFGGELSVAKIKENI
jgi:phage N-6-adenine-methyltransferase